MSFISSYAQCRTGTSARPNERRFIARLFSIVLSILCATISQAQEPASPKLEGYDLTFPAMGSSITLSAYSDSESKVEQAFNAVQVEIDRLVAILSDYEPDSELNRLHREATTPKPISNELYEVLLASERWHARSGDAFDVAIGNVTRLWREARKRREIPTKQEVEEAVRRSGWNKVELNQKDRTLKLLDSNVRIDLGGIAAGYIVDRAFDILLSHGLPHSLVNDGGDIRVGEPPPGREGWRIEIASLSSRAAKKNPPLRRILVKNAAITTSGDLWQFMEIDGQRRSHILDPKTGYGVVGPTMATVIAPTCIEADVAATVVSVLGRERGFALISEMPNLKALYASRLSEDSSIEVHTTEGFPEAIPDGDTPTK